MGIVDEQSATQGGLLGRQVMSQPAVWYTCCVGRVVHDSASVGATEVVSVVCAVVPATAMLRMVSENFMMPLFVCVCWVFLVRVFTIMLLCR